MELESSVVADGGIGRGLGRDEERIHRLGARPRRGRDVQATPDPRNTAARDVLAEQAVDGPWARAPAALRERLPTSPVRFTWLRIAQAPYRSRKRAMRSVSPGPTSREQARSPKRRQRPKPSSAEVIAPKKATRVPAGQPQNVPAAVISTLEGTGSTGSAPSSPPIASPTSTPPPERACSRASWAATVASLNQPSASLATNGAAKSRRRPAAAVSNHFIGENINLDHPENDRS